jgi:hypothetical protein
VETTREWVRKLFRRCPHHNLRRNTWRPDNGDRVAEFEYCADCGRVTKELGFVGDDLGDRRVVNVTINGNGYNPCWCKTCAAAKGHPEKADRSYG